MDLSKITSLSDATQHELLLIILSTQVQVLRRIQLLESKITKNDYGSVPELCEDITNKLDTFIKHLDGTIITKNN